MTVKYRRYLYALLTALFLFGFAVVLSRFLQWLIPFRWLEILVWFIGYFSALYFVLMNFDKLCDKYSNSK